MARTTKAVSSRNTKAEIYAAYQELYAQHENLQAEHAKLVEEKQALEERTARLSAAPQAPKGQETAPRPSVQAAVPPAQGIDGILESLTALRAGFGSAVNALSNALTKEALQLADLRSAIENKVQQLSDLYGITIAETTLDDLIRQYQDSVASFDQQAAEKQDAFEQEMAQLRASWEREQQEHTQATKERDDRLKTERRRKAQEYEYDLEKQRRLDAEQYAQDQHARDAELTAFVQAKQAEWAAREQALAEQEAEYEALRAKVEAFPDELEDARKRADKEGTDIARRQAKIRDDLLEKEEEGNRRVAELKIKSLEETIAQQAEQIRSLSAQLEAVVQQSQTLAIRAIEGASRETSFESIREIALEQAKRMPKGGQ